MHGAVVWSTALSTASTSVASACDSGGLDLTRRAASAHSHPDVVLRAEGHELPRNDVLPWLQRQPRALRDRCDDQPRFHHREAVADADARTAAKRQIRVARDAFVPAAREPLRVEALGILEEPPVALNRVGVDGDEASFGDNVAADLDVLDRLRAPPRAGG